MQLYRVDFDHIEWQSRVRGARVKAYRSGAKQCRLVEFSEAFVEPEWCEKGHVGLILEGELEIDFDGRVLVFKKGDGLIIPSGPASKHKARARTPLARLFLVESVDKSA